MPSTAVTSSHSLRCTLSGDFASDKLFETHSVASRLIRAKRATPRSVDLTPIASFL